MRPPTSTIDADFAIDVARVGAASVKRVSYKYQCAISLNHIRNVETDLFVIKRNNL